MADLIHLRGLEIMAVCGVLPEERERAQPFRFDITVEADLSAAGASDDLADTVHYGDLAERVVDAVTASSFQLLERLAAEVADVCLATAGVAAVTVSLDKLRPPIPHSIESTGVTIRREQP